MTKDNAIQWMKYTSVATKETGIGEKISTYR